MRAAKRLSFSGPCVIAKERALGPLPFEPEAGSPGGGSEEGGGDMPRCTFTSLSERARGEEQIATPRKRREWASGTCGGQLTPAASPVLIATPWYKPTVGGVAEVAARLRGGLVHAGWNVSVLVCEGRGCPGRVRRYRCSAEEGLWRICIPSGLLYRLTVRAIAQGLLRGFPTVRSLGNFLRKRGAETVILLYPGSWAWPFLLLRRLGAIRLIVSCHGNDLMGLERRPTRIRKVTKSLLRVADAVTVCAEHLAELARRISGDADLPVRVIDNCVDTERFTPPRRSGGANRCAIVHVSNFAPKKRTLDIVAGFAQPAVPVRARLVMVGDGPDRPAAAELARRMGIRDRLQFVGSVDDVRPHLRRANLFVLASEGEGSPLALLEAMACGLPYVSTRWGAAAILPPGQCGLVVPPRSPQAIGAAIGKMLGDPIRLRRMGRAARIRAESDFAPRVYVERHVKLLREVSTSPKNKGS